MATFTEILATELRKANPRWSTAQIAREIGVTRERVRQILQAEGRRTTSICYKATRICPQCRKAFRTSVNRFCSMACFRVYHTATLECEVCHKLFTRPHDQVRCSLIKHQQADPGSPRLFFCSKVCWGYYMGTHYGKGRPKSTSSKS